MSVTLVKPKPLTYPITEKSVWGPAWWLVMQQVASQYPDRPSRTDRMDNKRFYDFMIRNLPCIKPCRDNAYKHLRRDPFDYKNRRKLFASVIREHDRVNEETGKPERYGDNPDALLGAHRCEKCKIEGTTYNHFSHEGETEKKEAFYQPYHQVIFINLYLMGSNKQGPLERPIEGVEL